MSTDTKAPSAGAMRARFEKWAGPEFCERISAKESDSNAPYHNHRVQRRWEGWQAAVTETHVAELVKALEALIFDVQTRQFNTQHLHAANQALRRFKEGL